MKKTFPNKVFITREESGTENEYLQVNTTAEETAAIGEKKKVAVYVLQEVLTVETKIVAS